MKQRKVPLRMCSGCGQMFDKRQLVRVVKSPQGEVTLDKTGKKPGRGAYVCNNLSCLQMARKARRIERSLSTQIPKEIWEEMEQEMIQNE